MTFSLRTGCPVHLLFMELELSFYINDGKREGSSPLSTNNLVT